MKKLLSLLSVLTISGTAVPTTIAASPYQKEETLNSDTNYQQTNNLESLKRNKRDHNNVRLFLSVLGIQQLNNFWCGPAIGEAILRYFQISPMFSYGYDNFQSILSEQMHTTPQQQYQQVNQEGTTPENWINTMNQIINNQNLNGGRQYTITRIRNTGRSHISPNYSNFFNLVSNSLQNNMPAALAYVGNLPQHAHNENDINHFIIINGISGDVTNPSSWRYNYMDPNTGLTDNSGFRSLTNDDLNRLFWGSDDIEGNASGESSYLISYNPSNLNNNELNLEPMEIGNNSNSGSQNCTFGKYIANHITWKNFIPGYNIYHLFKCE